MTRLEQLTRSNLSLLQSSGIEYRIWQHAPILSYADAAKVMQQSDMQGQETKTLFLRLTNDRFLFYITFPDNRLDQHVIRHIYDCRAKIVPSNEMEEHLGCKPGAVCPFGHAHPWPILVDRQLCRHSMLLYTPGLPTYTIGLPGQELSTLLTATNQPYQWFEQSSLATQ